MRLLPFYLGHSGPRLVVPIIVELLTQSKTTTALADLSSLPAQLAQGDLGVRVDEDFPDLGLIDVQRYAEFPAHATDHIDLEGRAVDPGKESLHVHVTNSTTFGDRASSFPAKKRDIPEREHSGVSVQRHAGKTPYGNIGATLDSSIRTREPSLPAFVIGNVHLFAAATGYQNSGSYPATRSISNLSIAPVLAVPSMMFPDICQLRHFVRRQR